MPVALPAVVAVAWLLSLGVWAPATTLAHQPTAPFPTPQRYRRAVVAYTVPPVTLVDMHGTALTLDTALRHDGPVLLQFVYTTCSTTCPVMSGLFAALQAQFGSELAPAQLLSITIDPEHDTLARLQEYARQFRAGPQWRFLTGRRDDILAVQKAFDAYRGTRMRHEPGTYLRASPDTPWLRLDGLLSAAELMAEYRRLLTP